MAPDLQAIGSRQLRSLTAALPVLAARSGRARAAAATVLLAAVALLLRAWQRRRWRAEAWQQATARYGSMPWLQLSSPLPGSLTKLQWPRASRASQSGPECWRGFCPCCKRPVEARVLREKPPMQESLPGAKGKYAYVITLWGSSRAYVLGALVLGHSIRQTGTPHALVCLHTDDVPAVLIELLSKVWDCRLVEHVQAAATLSWEEKDSRFEKVFTKLRGMSLVDFEKVLMLDIDLLVLRNIDDLFRLPAPAALRRGMNNDGSWPYKHGDPIDGRRFFTGSSPGKAHSWGQGTGINAGVMLWQPSLEVLQLMLEELAEAGHPGHCRGNGPEQDYLSRYWADAPWTNMSVEYNFQLHHMFNALHPQSIRTAERIRCIGDPTRIRVVHFSGEAAAKPWHRVLDEKLSHMWPDRSLDEAYADTLIKEYRGYWLWVSRDKTTWDKVAEQKSYGGDLIGLSRGDDGLLYSSAAMPGAGAAPGEGGEKTLADMPEETLQGAVHVLRSCLGAWFDALSSAERTLGLNVSAALAKAAPLPARQVQSPASAPGKSPWFAKLPTPTRTGSDGPGTLATSSVGGACQRIHWHRSTGGWFHEQAKRGPDGSVLREAKASVVCGGREGANFVVFSWGEDGCDSFFPSSGEEVRGVFVKVVGRAARCFPLEDGDLSPLRIWADCANPGSVVLVAIVGLEAGRAAEALAALAPLGAPPGPAQPECCALAAAGLAGGEGSWDAAHASCDAAYASVLVPNAKGS